MSNNTGSNFTQSATGRSGWSTGGLGDLVGYIPGIGFNLVDSKNSSKPILGGGLKGIMPQAVQTTENYNEFSKTRLTLREAWNTELYACGKGTCGTKSLSRIITPFRAINNAGDALSRQNYSCGGPCQTYQSRPNVYGIRGSFGSVSKSCTPDVIYSGLQLNALVPAAACNIKYVYDSSNYTTFLKQQAMNKNYNDRSYAGNNSSGAQVSMRAIRRY